MVLIIDGLVARVSHIDDGQAAEPHRHAVPRKYAGAVRPAVGDDVRHPLDYFVTVEHLARKATDSTHGWHLTYSKAPHRRR